MKKFMDETFFLYNEAAVDLYNNYAKDMPIFDYHCHLSPKEIAEDKKYRNITEIWLGGDHYKWRALRSNGVEERYITGDADDKEKFLKWAETMPYCMGNPLFHWTHLELKRYFGIDKVLCPETAEEIWEACNNKLKLDEFSARNLIIRSNVRVLCTTDDPADSLEYHKAISKDESFKVKVLPAFRPDKGINIEKPEFTAWIARLELASGTKIRSLEDFKAALLQRLEVFHSLGCRLSDHAMEPIVYSDYSEKEIEFIFDKAISGKQLKSEEISKYKTSMNLFLTREYSRLDWSMQLHIGCLRNNNSRMFYSIGPDTGFDAISDCIVAEPLSRFLNRLDETCELPRTIIYCLNPRDNEVVAAMIGCFQGGIPGKIQFGSGWWFNDHKDGMIRQMTALANMGLLSRFVGMLTDSRSFLSYTRHEYFRRVLCNLLGEWAEKGEVPGDLDLLGKMVQDICFNNAERYFKIDF